VGAAKQDRGAAGAARGRLSHSSGAARGRLSPALEQSRRVASARACAGLTALAGAHAGTWRMLAVIGSEHTGERLWPTVAWLAPLGAALAVIVLVAGLFVLPGLLGGTPHGGGTAPGGPGHPAASGGRHGTRVRRTESSLVSSAVTGLVVQGSVGTVGITGGDRKTVSITAHLVYRGAAAVLTHRVTGGVLDVGYRCPARSRDCGVSFDVTVPRDLGVMVRWDVGQIRLDGLAGPITARTDVGRIQASGLSGPRIRLSTGTATVSAGFTAPPQEAVVTSGVGAVTIHVPAGAEYQVDASTQVGSVRVAVPRAAGSGHVIEATMGAGSVTVTH
jgi:hypothetical protein